MSGSVTPSPTAAKPAAALGNAVPSQEEITQLVKHFRERGLPALVRESTALDSRLRWVPRLISSTPSAIWQGVRAAWRTKGRVTGAVVHETPVALAVLLFLFVTSDIWRFLNRIDVWRFVGVCALFFVLGLIVLERALDLEVSTVHRFATRANDEKIRKAAKGMPAPSLIERIHLPPSRQIQRFRLDKIQQFNVRLVLFWPLLVLVALVALATFLFFVLLGVVGVDKAGTKGLTNTTSDPAGWTIPHTELIVSWVLVRVSVLIATVAALLFGVDVLREREVRNKLLGWQCEHAKQTIAAWVYYRQALENQRVEAEAKRATAPGVGT